MAKNDFTAIPEELAAATVADHDMELSGVQATLDRILSSGDDRTKKLIFNRVVCRMADALPEAPSERLKEAEPASHQSLRDATDKLSEAVYLAEFIQSISLNVPHDGSIILQPGQLTGFYYAMQNTIDRIKEAEVLIDTAMKQPDALAA
ncbi:MAG: hypothetical protein Q7U78_09115 [Gallionella sp.]|nr:hypothetical protein [Gallionella sp.]